MIKYCYEAKDVEELIKKIREYEFARDCLDYSLLLVIIFLEIGLF